MVSHGTQLPKRLARRLMDLQFLPHILVKNPHIKRVYGVLTLVFPHCTASYLLQLKTITDFRSTAWGCRRIPARLRHAPLHATCEHPGR